MMTHREGRQEGDQAEEARDHKPDRLGEAVGKCTCDSGDDAGHVREDEGHGLQAVVP